VATLGEATRRQVEERRVQDCASLMDRLVRRGLLDKRAEDDQQGQPNAYRLTTRALARLGHATLESLQAWCQEQLELHATSQIARATPQTPALAP
jgi:chromosome segregation and condensation protein ScpB